MLSQSEASMAKGRKMMKRNKNGGVTGTGTVQKLTRAVREEDKTK